MADPMSLCRLIIKAYVYIDDELRMGISVRKCIYIRNVLNNRNTS